MRVDGAGRGHIPRNIEFTFDPQGARRFAKELGVRGGAEFDGAGGMLDVDAADVDTAAWDDGAMPNFALLGPLPGVSTAILNAVLPLVLFPNVNAWNISNP